MVDLECESRWERNFEENLWFEEKERETFDSAEGRRWRVGLAQGEFSTKREHPKGFDIITSLP